MISTKEKDGPFDVIIVSGDAYVDHPSFGTAVIARVLESKGYSVGIIAQPDWRSKTDFMKLGKPGLYFGITAGNMDSMVANYTPLKKPREYDAYTRDGIIGKRPDMATIVYCNRLRECFKDVPLVIGGIEASLRRLAHYDYWKNSVRKSLLFDAKADVLVYGMGEHAVVELAKFYEDHTKKDTPLGIMNTCVKLKTAPEGHIVIPSFGEVEHDKKKFCEAFVLYSKNQKIAQQHTDWFLVQYPMDVMDEKEIDAVYDLPYSRKEGYHEKIPAFMTTRFSVVTHRGCFGNCSFCALALHQGKIIQSRSERSIIEEIQKITKLEGYRGTIDDMGGPSADMYG
ncbi:YgiQ family radical SAM protein, partial [Candidatus Woesearchaeota archaeon CG08_land_8_20_14_0_20_43_7]